MRPGQRLFQWKFWRQSVSRFSEWFTDSNSAVHFRLVLLTAPVVVYPIGSILINGPFIGKTFKWRYAIEEKLPEHLKKIVDDVMT